MSTTAQVKLDQTTIQTLIEAAPLGCAVFDICGNFVSANRTLTEILRCKPGTHEAYRRIVELAGSVSFDANRTLHRECRIDGRPFHLSIVPLRCSGQWVGHAVFLQDFWVIEKVEELTSDFISVASHELRNPLAALKNALEILRATGDDKPVFERFLAIALRNAQRIADMIDQYLEVARIEAGIGECSFQKVNLVDLIKGLIPEFHAQATSAGLQFQVDIPEDLPPVLGDPRRIEQVLFNLIGNAIKFTPSGGTVSVSATQHPSDSIPNGIPAMIEISVRDTGIGIPHDKRPLIFNKFYRIQPNGEPAPQGAGLGLAIVQHLVRFHGGEIFVEDNYPHGSWFRFTLPVYGYERRDPDFRRIFNWEFHRVRAQHGNLALFIVIMHPEATPEVVLLIKEAIKESLRRARDVVVQRQEGTLLVVFCEADSDGARSIYNRMRANIRRRLEQSVLLQNFVFGIGWALYPIDADSQRKLYRLALSRAQEDAHDTQKDPHR